MRLPSHGKSAGGQEGRYQSGSPSHMAGHSVQGSDLITASLARCETTIHAVWAGAQRSAWRVLGPGNLGSASQRLRASDATCADGLLCWQRPCAGDREACGGPIQRKSKHMNKRSGDGYPRLLLLLLL
jgi:hypothetical protein